MANKGGSLDGGRELVQITNRDAMQGSLLQKLFDGVNKLATNVGASPVGQLSAPKPPDSISVKISGEMMHISHSHSGSLNKGINYFTEISTTPNFGNPLVIHHGTSRTAAPITLPTYPDGGGSPVNYYIRGYAQYQGSDPSAPTVVGGVGSPTAFNMAGSTQMTLLTSTGSGTAPNNGQSAGQGFGKFQTRNS